MLKVLCPACERLTNLERFRFEGAALVVACARCGVETRCVAEARVSGIVQSPPTPDPRPSAPPRVSLVSAGASNVLTLRTSATDAVERAAQSAAEPFVVPDGLCPKCLARRGVEQSCAQCGLDFSRVTADTFALPPWLDERWRALLADWSNDALHSQTRLDAAARGALPQLGRLYRLRLAWVPGDPWAETGREEVLRLATSAVPTVVSAAGVLPKKSSSPAKLFFAVLALLAALGVAAQVLRLVFRSS